MAIKERKLGPYVENSYYWLWINYWIWERSKWTTWDTDINKQSRITNVVKSVKNIGSIYLTPVEYSLKNIRLA